MRQHWKWSRLRMLAGLSLGALGLVVGAGLAGCDDSGGGAASDEGGAGAETSEEGGGKEAGGQEAGGQEAGGQEAGGQEAGGQEAGGTESGEESGSENGEGGIEPGAPIISLLSDHNRNGMIDIDDPTERAAKDTWSKDGGAVFLANLDDDESKCPKFAGTDYELGACFDGADEVVNGPDDLLDMAPLLVEAWPDAPDTATGRLYWTPNKASKIRVFKRGANDQWTAWAPAVDVISAEELRTGVEFRLEGTGLVTNKAEWDGHVKVSLRVLDGSTVLGEDSVALRVAPLMLFHHLLPGTRTYAANIGSAWGKAPSEAFRQDLRDGFEDAGFNPKDNFLEYLASDQWTQDYFEPGVMTMPGPGGTQKEMWVHIRSANVTNKNSQNPLRSAGRVVFEWRGKDVAAVQIFDLEHPGYMDSLDSFGNTETIPPYSLDGQDYPLGRIYRGSVPNFYPDPIQSKMFEDQSVQPVVYTDTSWLLVGHVDETITFLTADNERGWVILSNDPVMAKEMLEEQVALGNGEVTMFKDKNWWGNQGATPAEISIQGVLDNKNVMAESLKSAAHQLEQENVLRTAAGLTDDEIFHIPYMHESVQGYSLAYQVGTINGLVLDAQNYYPPKTHGPEIDGVDIMAKQFDDVMASIGFTNHWVENWDLYHALSGEVHCGSNTMRVTPDVKWWETGR